MVSVAQKRPLATLPVPSTSFAPEPTSTHPGGDAHLRYEFQRAGVSVRGGIRFERVRAFRFRSEGHCTEWHVAGAYDTLVEVSPSEWAAELIRDPTSVDLKLDHYYRGSPILLTLSFPVVQGFCGSALHKSMGISRASRTISP